MMAFMYLGSHTAIQSHQALFLIDTEALFHGIFQIDPYAKIVVCLGRMIPSILDLSGLAPSPTHPLA